MRLRHLGHAAVLAGAAGVRVLIDPGTLARAWAGTTGLDAVVLTHAHPDHVDRESLPGLMADNEGAVLLAEPGLAAEDDLVRLGARALVPGAEVRLGDLVLRGHGGRHAVVHPDVPRVGNVGVSVHAPGEPVLLHPGDSYEATPACDVLAVPLAAPWAALAQTVDFVRAVRPRIAFPVHDAGLSPAGRELYLGTLTALGGTDVRDLGDGLEVEVGP